MNITTIPIDGFQVVVTKNRKIYLEQRCEKKAKPGEWINECPYYWKRIGNYPTIESACRAMFNQKLMSSGANDVQAILQKIENAQQEITRAARKVTVAVNGMAGKRIQSGTQAFL